VGSGWAVPEWTEVLAPLSAGRGSTWGREGEGG